MTDRLAISMPENLEDFLFAVPAVQELMFAFRAAKSEFKAMVRCRPEFIPLASGALFGSDLVAEIPREFLRDADLAVSLTHERAYAACGPAVMQAAHAYGTLLGVAPSIALPILGEDLRAKPISVLWLPRHATDYEPETSWPNLADFGEIVLAELGGYMCLDPNIDPAKAASTISGADMCVGVCGGLTLMAVALGKPLVELYPPLFNRWWASKWDSPDYRVFVNGLDHISADAVWESTKKLAIEVATRRRQWETRRSVRRAVA